MTTKKTYRLPGRSEVTHDATVYANAWRDKAEPVELLFQGYTLSGFDPDFQFTDYRSEPWRSFTLTLNEINALEKGLQRMKQLYAETTNE